MLGSALLAGCTACVAEGESRWYLTAGGGASHWRADFAAQARRGCGTVCDVELASLADRDGDAYRIGGGYRLTPNVALELAYVDLGHATSRYRTVFGGITVDVKGKYRLDGVQTAIVGRWPASEAVFVFGKAGALAARLRYSETGTEAFNPFPRAFTAPVDRATRPLLGLGAEYRLDSRWMLRGEWERYWGIGRRFGLAESRNGRFDTIDAFFVGLTYRF